MNENPSLDRVIALMCKWKYAPARRLENRAVQEAATEKQMQYIRDLTIAHPEAVAEMSEMLQLAWRIGPDEWSKADAMFIIATLAPPKKKKRGGGW